MPERTALLTGWLTAALGSADFTLEPASGDASFRRYWRVRTGQGTYVAMDAPPAQEDTERFVRLAERFRDIGLNTPRVHARDWEQGFLLLDDFGTRLYLDVLEADNAERLYGDALGALAVIQACGPLDGLPDYDESFLRRELEIFREWLLGRHLGLTLSGEEQGGIERTYDLLVASALEQPRVCVHRDYHSRNLMVTEPPSPGILDFQDAVVGPVTYDLVSLLRDCYIAWPTERVQSWAWGYFQLAVQSGILRPEDETCFQRWFDLMGAQRHLKAAGIFARLKERDGKPGYLADIPRTLGYLLEIAPAYPELDALAELIEQRVLPALA
jgi:aminoglycoside/choline kinase family phosphotransferase